MKKASEQGLKSEIRIGEAVTGIFRLSARGERPDRVGECRFCGLRGVLMGFQAICAVRGR